MGVQDISTALKYMTDLISNTRQRGGAYLLRNVYQSLLRHGVSRVYWPEGTPIFEEEWDVLLILDACRADMMRDIQNDYRFLGSPDTRYSVDSASKQWMAENFADRYASEIYQTAYITGNPYSDTVSNKADFALFDEVWKYAWDDDLGTVPPRPLTDRAITVNRELRPDRMVVHYMQPHYPFIRHQEVDDGIPLDSFGTASPDSSSRERDVWEQFKNGDLTESEIRELYLDNLRYVLNDISVLLKSITANTVVISSDHGNAFGEFGIYAHPPGMPLPSIREVPWYTTSASDTGEYTPETAVPDKRSTSETVDERLSDLGYL